MTDWLMVIITAVYVIATIFIMKANKESAAATKEQLEESKRQFNKSKEQAKKELAESKRQFDESTKLAKDQLEESKRQFELSQKQAEQQINASWAQFDRINKPNISVEIKIIHNEMWVLRFTNLGTQPAYDLNIVLNDKFIEAIRIDAFKNIMQQNNNKRLVLKGGGTYDIFYGKEKNPLDDNTPIKGTISYKDERGFPYSKEFELNAHDYAIVAHMDSEMDLLVKEMQEQTKAIKKLCSLISYEKNEKNKTTRNDNKGEE